MKYIIGEKSVTVYTDDGKVLTCGIDEYVYPECVKALNEERWDDMTRLYHKRYIEEAKEMLLTTGGNLIDDNI